MLPKTSLTVAALYHFARLADPAARQGPLLDLCRAQGLCGTLLLAPEGVNGTIAGPRAGILAVLDHIRAWPGFAGLDWKESAADAPPFARMKVRLKAEIVTMGQPDMDPATTTGHYVAPRDWNALIAAPDVVVIDTRNDYEIAIGSFRGAIDPGTRSFRDFPAWWRDNAHRFVGKRIAIAIGMVRAGYLVPLPIVHVLDEWNGRVVGAERRTGQGQAVIDIVIGFLDAIAPALGVACMVNLIEDHQSAPCRSHRAVLEGVHTHLRISHHNAVHGGINGGGIAKRRI